LPTISQFYGIVISMFFNDNEQHHLPHIHVEYSGCNATYDLEGNLIVGNIPNKQKKLVEAWIDIKTNYIKCGTIYKKEKTFLK